MILVCYILRKFDINSLYICPPYLYTVATLPWEIQKSHYSTVLCIHTSHYLHYLRRNKLQLLYYNLSAYSCCCFAYCFCVALFYVWMPLQYGFPIVIRSNVLHWQIKLTKSNCVRVCAARVESNASGV